MALEQAILGFLADGPATGYDLKTRCFDGAPRFFWTADQAQVYRTLDRLQKAGLVRSSRQRQRARPDRRLFELTGKGRQAVQGWLASSHRAPVLRDPFLLQVYLSAPLLDDELQAVLISRRSVHQERLQQIRVVLTALATDRTVGEREASVRRIAIEAVAARERSAIDWLDDFIDFVERKGLPQASASVAEPGSQAATRRGP